MSPTSGVARKTARGSSSPALVSNPAVDWEKTLTSGGRDPLPATSPLHVLILILLRIMVALFSRLRVKGSRVLPEGPKLFIASRPRPVDGIFVASALPLWWSRDVYFLVGEAHLRSSVLRFFAERSRVIVVSEQRDLGHAQRTVVAALRTGRSVVVFPETLPSIWARLEAVEEGYAAIAQHVGVPIVPVALQQSGGMPPAGVKMPKLGKRMDLTFLPAITPHENPAETSELVRRAIVNKISD